MIISIDAEKTFDKIQYLKKNSQQTMHREELPQHDI